MSYMPPVNTNYDAAQEESPGKGLAIASIICAVIFPLAIIGVILGIIAVVVSGNPGKRGARGLAIGALITSGIVLFLSCAVFGMAGVMLPALGKARQAARQLQSSTQLRAIGSGFMIYASNYKDQLPPAKADWQKLLQDSSGTPAEMFVSPAAQTPGAVSYFYVPPGMTIAKITQPATTVLAFEDPTNFRNRGTNILFVDGHIEYQTPPTVWSTLEGLKLSDGTVYHKPANAP